MQNRFGSRVKLFFAPEIFNLKETVTSSKWNKAELNFRCPCWSIKCLKLKVKMKTKIIKTRCSGTLFIWKQTSNDFLINILL